MRALPPGTASLSEAAMTELIGPMRDQGLSYHEAVEDCRPRPSLRHSPGRRRQPALPYYGAVLDRHVLGAKDTPRNEVERYGRIGNPTVHIGLNELRRLVNEIIDRYGKPDRDRRRTGPGPETLRRGQARGRAGAIAETKTPQRTHEGGDRSGGLDFHARPLAQGEALGGTGQAGWTSGSAPSAAKLLSFARV